MGAAGPVPLVPPRPLTAKAPGGAMQPAARIRPVSLHLREASLEGCASPKGPASPVYRSTGTRGPCLGGRGGGVCEMPGTAKRCSQLHREIVSSLATHGTGGGLFLLFPAGKRKGAIKACERWVQRSAQAAQLLPRKFILGLGFLLLPGLTESAWCDACGELLSARRGSGTGLC